MIVISNAFTLTAEFAAIEGLPLIGWESLVSTSNIVADTEDADFPATNLANPSTYLKWVGADTSEQYITVTTGSVEEIDYLAVARPNFGSAGIAVLIEGSSGADTMISTLLHFEGADASTTFTDSAPTPHTWTPAGDAQIDTGQFVFGASSGQFDGAGDYLIGDGDAAFAFGTSDFTIDFRIRYDVLNSQIYDGRPVGTDGFYPTIYTSGGVLFYFTDGANRITGTTVLSTGVWYHVALARSGTNTKLFLNGVQEGSTYVDSNNYINPASRPILGAAGATLGASPTDGWIDEFRISKGIARWTTAFTPPIVAYETVTWVELVQEQMPANDGPMLFQFEPQVLTQIRMRMASGSEPPEAAVVYVGKLLVVERSIKVDVDHIPIPLGRKTKVVNGMSESGNFLGRVVLHQHNESVAEFAHITPEWYRTYFDPFVLASQETPYFWAWHPSTYPQDVGFVWSTKDPVPEANPVTQRMAVELEMRGVV